METLSPFVLSWEPEIEDYREAFHARNRAKRATVKVAVIGMVPLLMTVFGLITRQAVLVGCGVGGFIGLGLMLGPGQRLSVRILWRRTLALRSPTQVHVVPGDGVSTSIAGSTGHFSWSVVDSFLETDRVFVLQFGGPHKGLFLVVAKRGLASPSDINSLRDLLTRETVGAKAN